MARPKLEKEKPQQRPADWKDEIKRKRVKGKVKTPERDEDENEPDLIISDIGEITNWDDEEVQDLMRNINAGTIGSD